MCSELTIARKSITITCTLQRFKDGQEREKAWKWKKGKASGLTWLEVAGIGKLVEEKLKQGIKCNWFGEHMWIFLVGPDLEAEAKNREGSNNWSCPAHCGSIAGKVVVWLPGTFAAEVVVLCPKLFVVHCGWEVYCHIWYGLSNVCLYIQFLISLFGQYLTWESLINWKAWNPTSIALGLFSHLHNQLHSKIVLTFLLYHHSDHLTRERLFWPECNGPM